MNQTVPVTSTAIKLRAIEALKTFTRVGEREFPIAFVGRDEILKRIATEIEERRKEPLGKRISKGVIISGAPGLGKTTLLTQIEHTYLGLNRFFGDRTIPIFCQGSTLNDPIAFGESFLEQSGREKRIDEFQSEFQRKSIFRGSVGISRTSIESGSESTNILSSLASRLAPQLENFWRTLATVVRPTKRETYVVLVDEAQQISLPEGVNKHPILTAMFDGFTSEFKLLPVCAGLSNTEYRLHQVGLTRTAGYSQKLGPLSHDESKSAVRDFLLSDRYGLSLAFDHQSQEDMATKVAVACEGWPSHLHHYIQGIANVVIENCVQTSPERTIDLLKVLDYGHRKRIEYCRNRRTTANLGMFTDVIMDVAEETSIEEPAISAFQLERVASDRFEMNQKESRLLMDRAVHFGLLEPLDLGVDESSKRFRFPIPSMRMYLSCRGQSERILRELERDYERRLQLTNQSLAKSSENSVCE